MGSGEREGVQRLALPRSYNTRFALHWLSERFPDTVGEPMHLPSMTRFVVG